MRRIFTSCVFVMLAAVTLGAQAAVKSETQAKADDAKVMTIAGCLRGGPSVFVLTNASAAPAPAGKDKPAGAAAIAEAYALVPRDGVTLAPHLGHRVELVGVVVAAPPPDPKTGAPRARVPGVPSEQFGVTSLKMVSPVCIE